MATAASCYATSIGGHIGLGSRALPSQDRSCRQRCFTVRCNAAQNKASGARGGAAAASRRSILAAAIALPFSVLYAERARAFVEGEQITDKVEKAAEKISTIVEQATDKVKDTVDAVVDKASEGSGNTEEAAKPKLPLRGPGSAERLREANIRVPTKEEESPPSPDDIDPSEAPYQRMDSSKFPDLPYLFPRENYGTPWVPPEDAPADKVKPFFGPWDLGPAPEKIISRPFIENEPAKNEPAKKDDRKSSFPFYLGLANLAVIGAYLIAKKAKQGELGTLFELPDLLGEEEGETAAGQEKPVQQIKAERAAFEAEEAERVARGESRKEDSKPLDENKH